MSARQRANPHPDSRRNTRSAKASRGAHCTKRPTAPRAHAHAVLVVDDNSTLCEPLLELLQSEGFRARAVPDGREALRTLRDGYPACVILLDLTMPIMDGWSFRAMQCADERLAAIPIVVVTALLDPQAEARKLGAVAGFPKPFDVGGLLRAIATHCPQTGRPA